MNQFKYIVLFYIFLASCSSNFEKENIEYGKQILFAGYDGITSTDYFWVYDNGIFKIQLSDFKGNGTYEIDGDTLILNYFITNDILPKAYLIESGTKWIDEYEKIKGKWKKKENSGAGFDVYKNNLKK
jgi:hypothetical protein